MTDPKVRDLPVLGTPSEPFASRPSHAQDAHAILDWAMGVSHDALPDAIFVRIARLIDELQARDEDRLTTFPTGNYAAELMAARTKEEKNKG